MKYCSQAGRTSLDRIFDPLIERPVISLAERHAKVRRDGYQK